MTKNDYKFSLTVSIQALDDPDARQQTQELVEAMNVVAPDFALKLQQVYKNKPPRGVKL